MNSALMGRSKDGASRNAGLTSRFAADSDKSANAKVSRAESIREFRILASDFTIESGG